MLIDTKVMVSTTDTDPAKRFTRDSRYLLHFNSATWTEHAQLVYAAYKCQMTFTLHLDVYSAGATYYSFGLDNIKVEALSC
jgi:hypothetical protein